MHLLHDPQVPISLVDESNCSAIVEHAATRQLLHLQRVTLFLCCMVSIQTKILMNYNNIERLAMLATSICAKIVLTLAGGTLPPS